MALDPSYFFYSDGTITLTNGSDIATGDMVAWDTALLPFDLIFPNDGADGLSVVKEVLSLNEIRLAKPWTGETLTNVPYFALRWVKHTDPKVYAVRVADYLTRLKAIPENLEAVADQIGADRQAVDDALVALQQIEQAVDADRQAAEAAVTAAQAAASAADADAQAADAARIAAEAARDAAQAGSVADNAVSTAKIQNDAVTNAKLADMPAGTVKANLAGSAADPSDVTLAALKAAMGGTLQRGALYGLTLANNATDAANDIDIAPGSARSGDDTVDMVLASGLTKRLDAAWAVGHNAGGLDTGAKAANSWYHVWLIRRDSDGAIDALFSGAPVNPVMPSGWTAKRRLGAVRTDASGNIRAFIQTGDWFAYTKPSSDVTASSAIGAGSNRTISVPLGFKLRTKVFISTSGSTAGYLNVCDPDAGVPTTNQHSVSYRNASMITATDVDVVTNTSGQIAVGDTGSGSFGVLLVKGWFDERGKFE